MISESSDGRRGVGGRERKNMTAGRINEYI
jgi:hypothetical protein